jgi:TetR/AcrR family transcriptional repressor of nem operon
MAKKKFNEEEVIRKAMELFWMKGYEATSMRDLVSHLGITTGSIYDSFGSKHELYTKALDQHYRMYLSNMIQSIDDEPIGRKSIEKFFQFMLGLYSSEKGCLGCFFTNSVVELSVQDKMLALRSAKVIEELENAFLRAVKRGQKDGSINASHNAKNLAKLLGNVFFGMNVQIKANNDPTALKGAIKMTSSILN